MLLFLWDIPPNIMNKVIKEYDAKIDAKKRITIRNPKYEYYHVEELDNGSVILKPRQIIDPLHKEKKNPPVTEDIHGPFKL